MSHFSYKIKKKKKMSRHRKTFFLFFPPTYGIQAAYTFLTHFSITSETFSAKTTWRVNKRADYVQSMDGGPRPSDRGQTKWELAEQCLNVFAVQTVRKFGTANV